MDLFIGAMGLLQVPGRGRQRNSVLCGHSATAVTHSDSRTKWLNGFITVRKWEHSETFFSALISGLCGKEKAERVQNKVILLHKGMWPNFFLHFLDRKIQKSLYDSKRYSHTKGSQAHTRSLGQLGQNLHPGAQFLLCLDEIFDIHSIHSKMPELAERARGTAIIEFPVINLQWR